jgi:hypothetical protein
MPKLPYRMKIPPFSLGIAFSLWTAGFAADTPENYAVESRSNTEIFSTKITKVYEFREGDAEYQAYVVKWRDHEVVVTRPFGSTEEKHHSVGDVIRCTMNQMSVRRPDGTMSTRITFLPAPSPFAAVTPEAAEAHIQAVAAEVARRRQMREAAIQHAQADLPPTPSPPEKPSK